MLVTPDAVFDRFGVLLALKQGLPGVDVLGLVEVTVGQEREALEADGREDVVAIGDFPRVNNRRKDLLVLPQDR